MALGNGGSTTANGAVNSEKAPVVNGTNMETLPRTGKQVRIPLLYLIALFNQTQTHPRHSQKQLFSKHETNGSFSLLGKDSVNLYGCDAWHLS